MIILISKRLSPPNSHPTDFGYSWHKIQQIGWKPVPCLTFSLFLDSLLQCSAHFSDTLDTVFSGNTVGYLLLALVLGSDNSGLMVIQYVTTKEKSTSNPVTLVAFTLHPNQRSWLVTHKIDWQLTQAIMCGRPFSECQLWVHLDWI